MVSGRLRVTSGRIVRKVVEQGSELVSWLLAGDAGEVQFWLKVQVRETRPELSLCQNFLSSDDTSNESMRLELSRSLRISSGCPPDRLRIGSGCPPEGRRLRSRRGRQAMMVLRSPWIRYSHAQPFMLKVVSPLDLFVLSILWLEISFANHRLHLAVYTCAMTCGRPKTQQDSPLLCMIVPF